LRVLCFYSSFFCSNDTARKWVMVMSQRLHSVVLDEEECKGCTNCIKKCPTEAIRVREGKAQINTERCIDCGECIRNCPNHAKKAVTDGLEALSDYKYTAAMPAPALYGQFGDSVSPDRILRALLDLKFDDIFEVARGADIITVGINKYLDEHEDKKAPRPLISPACPAIVRLIQVRFPDLIEHLLPLKSPMEVAAQEYKKNKSLELGIDEEEIGAFFITPCSAKAISIKQPAGLQDSAVDGTVSIEEIYGDLVNRIEDSPEDKTSKIHHSSGFGIGWARSGGENQALGRDEPFVVDGIHKVIEVLEEIEMGSHSTIDYLEGYSCVGGCVGGPLTVTNSFVAKLHILKMSKKYQQQNLLSPENKKNITSRYSRGDYSFDKEIESKDMGGLDKDFKKAIHKMEQLEETVEHLPGLDCGSCGAPECEALAEDIVRGLATETDCIFKLRERVSILAEELSELAKKVPPAMGQD